MRRIIVGAQVSIDGVMQAPGGPTEEPGLRVRPKWGKDSNAKACSCASGSRAAGEFARAVDSRSALRGILLAADARAVARHQLLRRLGSGA